VGFHDTIADEALIACQRCCCLCQKFCGVNIELHHIKQKSKGGEDTFENCIPLCFDCHAVVGHYNTAHPRGRKFSETELRKIRDNWYAKVKELNTPLSNGHPAAQHQVQNVNGNGNIVAGGDININRKVINKTSISIDPGGKHIANETARKIQELVKEYIDINAAAGKSAERAAQKIWKTLKNEFNVTSYKEIKIEDSENVIAWLYAQLAMQRPKVRRSNPEVWRQSFYKPIYARAGELGMNKEQVYAFAKERIPLKKSIRSLKDLSQKELERLHNIMVYEHSKYKGN
jgi:hypothetical protein